MVAQFERGKRLHEQCERDGPCITGLTAPRQRLVSAYPDFDMTPLEVMHVSQTDERPRSQRWRLVTSSERPFEPLPSLLEQTALRPEPKQRAGKFESLLGERRRRQRPFERRSA